MSALIPVVAVIVAASVFAVLARRREPAALTADDLQRMASARGMTASALQREIEDRRERVGQPSR